MLNVKRNVTGDWLTKHMLTIGTKIDSIVPELKVMEVNDFEEDSGADFDEALWEFFDKGQTILPIVVDSFGGQVYTLLRFLDTLDSLKKAGATIMTIGRSKCMSCGSVLVSAGTKGFRFIDPSATIMIHEVSSGIWSSKNEEVQASAEETERLNKLLLEQLSIFSGKNKNFYKKEIHRKGHADWFISAKEAVHLGLVDKIGSPKIKLELKLDMTLETK